MQNIQMQVVGNTLTLTIDISKRLGASKSGKTVIIASTEGNVKVPNNEGISIGVNVYTK